MHGFSPYISLMSPLVCVCLIHRGHNGFLSREMDLFVAFIQTLGQTSADRNIIFRLTWSFWGSIDLYAELTAKIRFSWCSNIFWSVHLTQTTQSQRAGFAPLPHLISHPNQPLHCVFFLPLLVFSLHSWHSQGNNTEFFSIGLGGKMHFLSSSPICVCRIHIQRLSYRDVYAAPSPALQPP